MWEILSDNCPGLFRKEAFEGNKGEKGIIFNLGRLMDYTEYIMQTAVLNEPQAGIKIAGRNINNFRYADDTTLMAENEEELKSLLWGWKRRVKYLA